MITGNKHPQFARHILPKRNSICEFCQALMWEEEIKSNLDYVVSKAKLNYHNVKVSSVSD